MAADSRNSGVHSTPASATGLARGDHRELREAVDEIGAAVFEVRARGCSPSLRRRFESAVGETSVDSMGAIPERPSASARANSAVFRPRAQMAPMPVMATRRMRYSAAFSPADFASSSRSTPSHICRMPRTCAHFFIGDADVEFVFEREEDLHGVHGVDAQLHEIAVDGHRLDGDSLGRWR